ncbi:MAG: hypothetical protein WC246_02365 [Candidatus Paceibacterota bacterium]|jgi:hypothetical protein
MKKLIIVQFYLLLAGTLFAWTNFGIELYRWIGLKSNNFGCTPGATNPFMTACFYGAIFFAIAFGMSARMYGQIKKSA